MTHKKKLSILIYSLAGGGAERVVSILLNELKDKFNITLVLMNDTILYDIPNKLKIIYLENSNPNESGIKKLIKLPILGLKYKKICKDNNIDISLSFMNRPNYINIISKLFGNKIKIIISERAMPSLQHKIGLQGKINIFLITCLYHHADIITANSLGNSLDLKNNFAINNILTISNPVDIKQILKLSKENIILKKEKFTFITIGRLDRGKNHQLVINAMKDIDAKLYIIGDGELKNELENQIKKLKLEKNIFLLGYQENPYKYLVKADCFIFSSNNEGFPNVLLEALSCGLPIISTDCQSGPREILAPKSDLSFRLKDNIEKVEYGILTPINDKENLTKSMNLMINNDKLFNRYKLDSRIRASDFNKDQVIAKFIKIIEGSKC